MNPVITLALKDLKLLVRDKPSLFFSVGFPLIFAVFFGTIFSAGNGGGGERIPIALVDEDRSERSRALVESLTGAPELIVTTDSASTNAVSSASSTRVFRLRYIQSAEPM